MVDVSGVVIAFHRVEPTPKYSVNEPIFHNADCLDAMAGMADGSVDLIVTSPPYNLGTSTGNGFKTGGIGGVWANAKLREGYATYADNLPVQDYADWQRTLLAECWRLIPEDGAIFYNHKPRIQGGVVMLPQNYAPEHVLLRQVIIWDRGSGMNFNRSFFTPSHEYILLFAKPKFRLTKSAADKDVWRINPERNNDHPAPFPLELAKRCIQHTTAETVMDPFMGSGTVGVACAELGRSFVGIELDQGYFQMAKDRICGAQSLAA